MHAHFINEMDARQNLAQGHPAGHQMAIRGNGNDKNQRKIFFTATIKDPSVAFETQRNVLLRGLLDSAGPSLS